MKYQCNLIKDMLPLYYEGLCSDESKRIIEEHLKECSQCRECYRMIASCEEICGEDTNAEWEKKKADSMYSVRKRIVKRQLIVAALVFFIIIAVVSVTIGALKNIQNPVVYENNITVEMKNGKLIGKVWGNQADYVRIRRVETESGNDTKTYLVFCMKGSKWNDIMTDDNLFSEYILCEADKGAGDIDKVFYYTGEYENLESLDENQLEDITASSILLWKKS